MGKVTIFGRHDASHTCDNVLYHTLVDRAIPVKTVRCIFVPDGAEMQQRSIGMAVLGVDFNREMVWMATTVLVGAGTIQERLALASDYLLSLHRTEDKLSEAVREDFRKIWQELGRQELQSNDGTVLTPMRDLSDEEAVNLAQRIVVICMKLHGGL